MTALDTALTRLLGIRAPILLAPMDRVAGGALSAAVSAAGGLGLIGGGYGDGEQIEQAFLAAGNQRVGVGFITWSLARQPELLSQALTHDPVAVMLSFGDPAPFADQIRATGAKLICQVHNLSDARAAAAAGADVIVAQGAEAGGHGGGRSTFTLVPAVVDAVGPIPVVAAGGVADGRALAAALMLGGAGVLMGTRFCATREAQISEAVKARIVAGKGDETLRGKVYDIVRQVDWPARYTGRVLLNDFARQWAGREERLLDNLAAERARYLAAREADDYDIANVTAGEAVDMIHDIPAAGDLVARMIAEAEAALGRGAAGS